MHNETLLNHVRNSKSNQFEDSWFHSRVIMRIIWVYVMNDPSWVHCVFLVAPALPNENSWGRALTQNRGQDSKEPYLIRLFGRMGAWTVHYLACGACSIEWTWLWYWRPSPPRWGLRLPGAPPRLGSRPLWMVTQWQKKQRWAKLNISLPESTTQDSNTVLLFLVPRYGIHFGVRQEMRAVSDLNINHSLFGFVLDKLVGYPLYGLSVSAEKPQRETQNEWRGLLISYLSGTNKTKRCFSTSSKWWFQNENTCSLH